MSQEANASTIFDKIKEGPPEKKDPVLEELECIINELQHNKDKKEENNKEEDKKKIKKLALSSSAAIVAKKS